MTPDKFLKIRVPSTLYKELLTRANAEGKRLGTYTREQLQLESQTISTKDALSRIEVVLRGKSSEPATKQPLPDTTNILKEILLLLRELAISNNAQILVKVAAQLKSQQANQMK